MCTLYTQPRTLFHTHAYTHTDTHEYCKNWQWCVCKSVSSFFVRFVVAWFHVLPFDLADSPLPMRTWPAYQPAEWGKPINSRSEHTHTHKYIDIDISCTALSYGKPLKVLQHLHVCSKSHSSFCCNDSTSSYPLCFICFVFCFFYSISIDQCNAVAAAAAVAFAS